MVILITVLFKQENISKLSKNTIQSRLLTLQKDYKYQHYSPNPSSVPETDQHSLLPTSDRTCPKCTTAPGAVPVNSEVIWPSGEQHLPVSDNYPANNRERER